MLSKISTGVEDIQLLSKGSSFKDLNGLGGGFLQPPLALPALASKYSSDKLPNEVGCPRNPQKVISINVILLYCKGKMAWLEL